MELTGKFLENEARRRLLSLPELDIQFMEEGEMRSYKGGKKHRKYVAALISSKVEVKKNEVVLEVGALATSKGRHFGFYIEMGSAKLPASPWLRPAIFENADNILKLLSGR
jgi:hypothetical protein